MELVLMLSFSVKLKRCIHVVIAIKAYSWSLLTFFSFIKNVFSLTCKCVCVGGGASGCTDGQSVGDMLLRLSSQCNMIDL